MKQEKLKAIVTGLVKDIKTERDISASKFRGRQLKHLRSARHRALIAAIVEARQTAGLTQRQLAAKLKQSNSFVWKIEAGERRVEVLEFVEIARCLGVSPTVLLARALRK